MDNIANMLTSIRNAQSAGKETAVVPCSKIKLDILKIMERKKFIGKPEIKGRKNKKIIEIAMLYDKKGNPAISHLKRVSVPSKRVYAPLKKIHPVQYGKGLQIISTPKGLLTNKEAKKEKVGGEVICEIW